MGMLSSFCLLCVLVDVVKKITHGLFGKGEVRRRENGRSLFITVDDGLDKSGMFVKPAIS